MNAFSRTLLAVALCARLLPAGAQVSHMDQPILGETAAQVSDHVWQIAGFPNVAIVVGPRATLVVDTGLGPRNGRTAARVAARLSRPKSRLFLTTTHFHPEHAFGEGGFPAGTVIIRNAVQQREMDEHGLALVELFKGMTPLNKALLDGAVTRPPDILFDRELRLDLGGGVTARLLWLGAAHTKGDQLVFVEPDGTLISGDVIQNRTSPFIHGQGGTAASWIAAIDEAARLEVRHLVPDHSPVGDRTTLDESRAFLVLLRQRALAMKQQGLSAERAGELLTAELKSAYPDWHIDDVTSFVQAAYSE
ncbi:MBL fold metallo-hydrolase [Mitsuaria sp. 7]|uniref:MBL fold metallo-hydrolase n=1 Tax=Mitsuaria sp. 7 TaxID=1658665 RepID=UPI00082DA2A0|nr:MBL fold metallo-hydrolase [Mitsuaria sp. 7]